MSSETVNNTYTVTGGTILAFGDLHLSSVYTGSHKNYVYECYHNMNRIEEICEEENPSCIFFLGDIMGVNERTIKDHRFLMRVVEFFEKLNKRTNNNVYAVKGNHDISDFSDFDFLLGLRLIKNPRYVDYIIDGHAQARFHIVNYGKEREPLAITSEEEDASNVVFGHNNYYISGVTNWYSASGAIEISSLRNMKYVDLIISGHIHNPSAEMLYANIEDQSVGIFYVGSPSRVQERIKDCWYATFAYDDTEDVTNYNVKYFGLVPLEEAFYEEEEPKTEEEQVEEEKRIRLEEMVKEIIESRLTGGNLYNQIDSVPGFSDTARALAKEYLTQADN